MGLGERPRREEVLETVLVSHQTENLRRGVEVVVIGIEMAIRTVELQGIVSEKGWISLSRPILVNDRYRMDTDILGFVWGFQRSVYVYDK